MPALLRVLAATYRRAGVVTALQQHRVLVVIGMVRQPLIDHEQRERGLLPQVRRVALGLSFARA